MGLTIKNNREIYPQKVATKQGEVQTTILTFTYKYEDSRLAKNDCKAYAITSFNGEIDMTELTKEVIGSEIKLTWVLSERVLRYAGAIVYQIVFKGEKDSPAVFSTYQAIIQNSESIDADNSIVSDYPTIMKQWLDLINARSGSLPQKIVYMQPDDSIPVEERTSDTLYYQWEDQPTMTATAATGIVNLGSTPYADSGLYINGTHVYVDNTSDTVYVLEPSVWVDTINNANVGVIATDESYDDEVRILLTASTAGEAGNNITYELGLAQYGAGKGNINPSGGTTQGATLRGGYDTQIGVDDPKGRFEDHFGNILGRLITEEQMNSICMVPDYSNAVADINAPFTAPSNGYIMVRGGSDGTVKVTISGIEMISQPTASSRDFLCIPISKSDVATEIVGSTYRYFVPSKQFSF